VFEICVLDLSLGWMLSFSSEAAGKGLAIPMLDNQSRGVAATLGRLETLLDLAFEAEREKTWLWELGQDIVL
jgi:hypothetical protein